MSREFIVTEYDIGCDGEMFGYKVLVRCKDCKYYYKDPEDGYEMCDNSEGHDHITDDGFCYWGERKVENV